MGDLRPSPCRPVADFVLHTWGSVFACREGQGSLPRQFCILVLRFVGGFHPATSPEAVPTIGVRFTPELGLSLFLSLSLSL